MIGFLLGPIGRYLILAVVLYGTWKTWLWQHDAGVRREAVQEVSEELDRQTRAREHAIEEIRKEAEALPDVPTSRTELERLCKSDPLCDG